jgi:quercetin dioxygenase-like cupin family protein
MPFISHADAPTFSRHGASFTGLASPQRGATETAVWIVSLAPGSPGTTHQLTREEVFVGIEGHATASVDGCDYELGPGSALIVPAHTNFTISNHSDSNFRALAVLPVGGQAQLAGELPFTPPWAA